ncbi:Aspartyl/glutamyl-tRNA(Asn/Gln) amidotransferase subunit B [bacterium AB1]|nr:Aspartyl/glutamyl-tRNA(Asn/Gln) amidotransferase subunit B [bacterium AB1]
MNNKKNQTLYTIGLEIHVQLNTEKKLFSLSNNDNQPNLPNINISAYDIGLPGTYPYINHSAIQKSIHACKIFNCQVSKYLTFDRKHYFYPDLPLSFQVTQQENPIGINGKYQISKNQFIRINNIHIETDAGKIKEYGSKLLLDYNRCGCPLIEIVTEPDFTTENFGDNIESSIETFLMLTINDLKQNDISQVKLELSNFRVDVNISCRIGDYNSPRYEIKNLNSINAIKNSVIEAKKMLENKDFDYSVTLQYDELTKKISGKREKINADGYMYMYEPTLPPIDTQQFNIEKSISYSIEKVLYIQKKLDFLNIQYILKIISNNLILKIVEHIVNNNFNDKKSIIMFVFEIKHMIEDINIKDYIIISLCELLDKKEILKINAVECIKDLYNEIINTTKEKGEQIIQQYNLMNVVEEKQYLIKKDLTITKQEIVEILNQTNNLNLIEEFNNGNTKLLNFGVGLIMKHRKGINPLSVKQIIIDNFFKK